jgi:hypothetical protein
MKISSKDYAVHLRNVSIGDADRIASIANDQEIARNIAAPGKFPYPYKRDDALAFIESTRIAYLEGIGIHLGIALNGTGVLVGAIGVKHLDMNNKRGEIGYWVGKEFWGNGYAKEAIKLILGLSFSRIGMNKISANVFPFNTRSISMLSNLGFRKDATLRENIAYGENFIDELVYSILKSEYTEKAQMIVEE